MNRALSNKWALALLISAIIYAFGELTAHGQTSVQSPKSAFSLKINAINSSVKVGIPVWVEVSMENKSSQDLSVYRAVSDDQDQGGWVYMVDVRAESGKPAAQTKYARSIGAAGSGGYIPLSPGKTLTDRVNISKLYDLSQPRKYTIQLQRLDEKNKLFVKSNKITVTVTL